MVSNVLAVATVTAALRRLVSEAIAGSVAGAQVTHLHPETTGGNVPRTRVNLYLYETLPSAHWRNEDLPTRRGDGSTAVPPVAALDLHYLLTFYGEDKDLEPQRLLGSTVAALHARPVLSPERVEATIAAARATDANHYLARSDLATQPDPVRLTPLGLSAEDMATLWSSLFRAAYRLSVGYQASVVLVEAPARARPSLPVRRPAIVAAPTRLPLIGDVRPGVLVTGSAEPVEIAGSALTGPGMKVVIGGHEVDPAEPHAEDLLSAGLPAGLRAGPVPVEVIHRAPLGDPPQERVVARSNVRGFILAPRITTPSPLTVARGATLTVAVEPEVGRRQAVQLLIGPRIIDAAERTSDGTTVRAAIPADFPSGSHLLRVRVDGAESPLHTGGDGAYAEPVVTVT